MPTAMENAEAGDVSIGSDVLSLIVRSSDALNLTDVNPVEIKFVHKQVRFKLLPSSYAL